MTTMLIDSSFLAYQAMATHGVLKNEDVLTGVVYGIFSRLLSIGTRFKTNDFHFCFDGPREKSIRREQFAGYKNRPAAAPEEVEEREQMFRQLSLFREIVNECGWPCYFQEQFESDDLIAALALVGAADGKEVCIVSGDGDLHQLLCPGVFMFHPTKHRITREADLPYRAGEVVRMKAIGGCASDTVPGVPGVAATRALQYIRGDYKQLSPPGWVSSIEANTQIIARNLDLVRLPHSKLAPVSLVRPHLVFDVFRQYCEDLGFESFLASPALERWRSLFNGDYQTLARESTAPAGVVSRRRTRREQTEGFGL